MVQPSECACLGVRGRPVLRPRGHLKQDVAAHVEEELGAGAKTVKGRRKTMESGGLVQGRKDAACRQGCRLAGSLGGRRRALIASSDHRAAHGSCDGRTSIKMRVGAMRMYVSDIHAPLRVRGRPARRRR
jgi:hypothetical protein